MKIGPEVLPFTKSNSLGMSRQSIAVVLTLATCLLATACASNVGGSSDAPSGPIKIGVLASTTGSLATYGIAEKQGIEIAFADANAAGGINGQKLEAVWYDPAGDTAKALEQVNRMVQQDGVQVILDASASSGVALAIKPILQASKIVTVSAGAAAAITDPATDSPYTFGTTLSTDLVAAKMAEYLQSKSIKSVGVISSSDGYGQSGAGSLKAAFTKAGITEESVEYDPATTDLTPQLRAMQGKNLGAIINWTSGNSGVVYFKNAKQLNLSASAQIMSSFTFSNPALMKQAGAASEGAVVAGITATLLNVLEDSDPQKTVIAKFDAALQKEYKVPVTIYAAQAHDSALVAIAGIKAAKTTETKALASAIEKLTVDGIQGTYNYSTTDHRGLGTQNLEMMQWNGTEFVRIGGK